MAPRVVRLLGRSGKILTFLSKSPVPLLRSADPSAVVAARVSRPQPDPLRFVDESISRYLQYARWDFVPRVLYSYDWGRLSVVLCTTTPGVTSEGCICIAVGY